MTSDPFTHFPILIAGDFILREIEVSDTGHVHEFSYYNGEKTESLEETVLALERIKNDYRNREAIHWGIAHKDEDIIIGSCGYYRGFRNSSGEIGYVLSERWRGKGVMKEVLRAAIDFGFQVLKLAEVKGYTKPGNAPSIAVLKRAGFVQAESEVEGYIKFIVAPSR